VYLEVNTATISDSDFAHDKLAINIETTGGPDYAYLGDLPDTTCVPTWVHNVFTSNTWFAPHGFPTPSIGLGDIVAVKLPSNVLAAYNFTGVITALNTEKVALGTEDQAPWSLFSCGPVQLPDTAVIPRGWPSKPTYAWVGKSTPVDFK